MAIEFRKDGPWELPAGWVWARAGDVLPLEYGKAMSARLRDGSGSVPVYGSAGIVGVHSEALTNDPCLIIARKGSVGAVFEETQPCWPIDTVYYSGSIVGLERRFAYWFLKFFSLKRLDQSTAVPSLSRDKYNDVWMPVAPLSEQKRIVARIDELFTEIADGETVLARARADLDTWRRALLKAAVTGELTREWRENNAPNESGRDVLAVAEALRNRFGTRTGSQRKKSKTEQPDWPELPEIPSGWVWAKLSDFAWASSYGTSVKCSPDADGIAVLRIPNIKNGRIDLQKLKRATVDLEIASAEALAPGDILVIRTNGSADLIGRAALVTSAFEEVTYFASYLIRFRIVADERIQEWISLFLSSPIARAWVQRNIASSAGQYNISQSALMNLPIPVPPSSEMRQALDVCTQLDSVRRDSEIEAAKAQASSVVLRQSTLKSAFEGRLVDQDPADEPAELLLGRISVVTETEATPHRGRRRVRAAQ